MANLLIIDDEPIGESLALAFRRGQYEVTLAHDAREGRGRLEQQLFDIIVCDITLPDGNGIELLEFARQVSPDSVFVLMTGKEHPQEVIIQALNLGADRYIVKSDRTIEEVESVVRRAEEYLRTRRERDLFQRAARELARDNIIGQSRPLRAALEIARAIAPTNSTVLVTGESGTGKELVARRIHELSPRFDRPFVSLNCGAFPETLLESELFGYVKGAFTGATHSKPGLFQAAHGGTLFLDEIGEMSLPMQVKLLRVLQERKVRPLGSTEESSVDVRVIAATNKDLRQLVAEKSFREDLFYRISVIPLHMPPLRERSDDIPLLALHFLQRYSEQMNKPLRGLSAEALEALRCYSWPGNVRELENVIERAVALESAEEIGLRSLAEHISRLPLVAPGGLLIPDDGVDFQNHIEEQERAYLLAALEKAGGVRTKAAELLGISYRSFRHYAKKHRI
ncbi:MAG TPA: sigma-54 dependent transcriptional regulator [Candidatus Acidoferrales bacterium]